MSTCIFSDVCIYGNIHPLNPRGPIRLQDEYGNRILDDDGKEIYESFYLRFRFFRTWWLIVEVVVWNEGNVRVMDFFVKKADAGKVPWMG